MLYFFFFFNDTATTEIYTLSLHDALPISLRHVLGQAERGDEAAERDVLDDDPGDQEVDVVVARRLDRPAEDVGDRKSTRLNSSHANISYAVFCLKKKTQLHSYTITSHPY